MMIETTTTETQAQVNILLGDDQVAVEDALQQIIVALGPADVAQMNITRLDGSHATLQEITSAAQMIPFGVARRLVIVENAAASIKGADQAKAWTAFLEALPPSCSLLLLIPDAMHWKSGVHDWQVLHENHWLRKWAEKQKGFAHLQELSKPEKRGMPEWISKQVAAQGGSFEEAAVSTLAELVGQDTLLAKQEIYKILTYTGTQRTVTKQEVELLCAPIPQENIFALVDAIGLGNGQRALHLLNDLLQQQEEINIFNMIVRQFRLLIITKELLAEGGDENAVMKEVGVMRFVARNLITQARRFAIPQLEQIHQHLYDLEGRMKSGKISSKLAMELFIIEVAKPRK